MAIRGVMFDFGGVISTSPFEAFARLETEQGLPAGFVRTVNSSRSGRRQRRRPIRKRQNRHGHVRPEGGRAGPAPSVTIVDGRAVLATLGGALRPQMVAAIQPAAGPRYKTACLTNNFVSVESHPSEEVAAVYALFDAVLESRVLGVRKPDPRFYELACTAVGVAPEEAVFLDDLGVNLKPARALGMHTIKVTDPDVALAELECVLEHPIVLR